MSNRRGGFTLIEVLMVLVLLGIVGSLVMGLLVEGARSFQLADVRGRLASEATLAMERISREVRRMGCTTAGTSCNPTSAEITAMTPTELRFVRTDNTGLGVRLDAGSVKLRRGSGSGDPEDVLASGATSFTLDYLRDDGTTAVTESEVWLVRFTLTLSEAGETVTMRTLVHPRSFR